MTDDQAEVQNACKTVVELLHFSAATSAFAPAALQMRSQIGDSSRVVS
ncbi:hypothetical protein [Biformimicrobium ophioploci]|nr:hypothetical protein [Microbulbifer sp. NKW57]